MNVKGDVMVTLRATLVVLTQAAIGALGLSGLRA